MKKVLILGATGAMGTYLVPELLACGFKVDGVTLDKVSSDNENLEYITADATDYRFLKKQLDNNYDAVVDFMQYNTLAKFAPYADMFLEKTAQYVYVSTARVYADVQPAKEDSLRIIDADMPKDFVREYEYCIFKAQEENYLNDSGKKNFTIARPTITYSKRRFQLVTLEADTVVRRTLLGKPVVLPEGAIDKHGTLTWAGDTAKMFATILKSEKALGETYTLTTSEHYTWRQIAELYHKLFGLEYVVTDNNTYLDLLNPGSVSARQQLIFSRCYDRIYDNTKILELAGLTQKELIPLESGLKMELSGVKLDDIRDNPDVNKRMDEFLGIK